MKPHDDSNGRAPRLACADFSFPLLTHDVALDLIAGLEIGAVDIGLHQGRTHVQPSDFLGSAAAAARELSAKVRDRGLELADMFLVSGSDFRDLCENHPEASVREKSRGLFLRALEFAALCAAPHMTTLPGIVWEEDAADESMRRAAEELAWRGAQAAAAGVKYSVEPHLWSVAPTPQAALELVRRVPGLTLTLDYGHFTAQGIADQEIEPLVAHASHFHARCACPGKLQTDFAHNTIDHSRVLRAMQRSGYSGWVGLEYVRMELEITDRVDNLAETILLRDHLREISRATS